MDITQKLTEYSNSARQVLQGWIDEMPNNTLECAKRGAIGSLAISGVLSIFTPSAMITAVALSATATVVDALVNPLFAKHFAKDGEYSYAIFALKQVVVYGSVCSAAALFGLPIAGIPALLVVNMVSRYVFGSDADLSVKSATSYLFG